jgi:hypothetical protein
VPCGFGIPLEMLPMILMMMRSGDEEIGLEEKGRERERVCVGESGGG